MEVEEEPASKSYRPVPQPWAKDWMAFSTGLQLMICLLHVIADVRVVQKEPEHDVRNAMHPFAYQKTQLFF